MALRFKVTSKGSRELDKIEREGKKSGRITISLNIRRWVLRTLIKQDQTKSQVVTGVSKFLKLPRKEVTSGFNSTKRSGLIT